MATPTVAHPTAEEHATRFKETHQGKGLSDEQIDGICVAIRATEEARLADNDEVATYYKANIISLVFYCNVLINCYMDAPPRFLKHFVGHTGGVSFPGDSLFTSCELHTCPGYTFEDIFTKQDAIEVDSESIMCFIRFFDKNSNLLGWLWGAGAGSVIGIAGGKGEWGDGPLSPS